MIVSLYVAMDQRGGIGLAGRLPWRLSTDLKRFKKLTLGHHLVMGRKTWEAIGRPLPGRTSIVLTHQRDYQAEGCLVSHSLEDALKLAQNAGEQEVFVIGGGEIYTHALPLASKIYLSEVQAVVQADVFFPETDWDNWTLVETLSVSASEKDEYSYVFKVLERRRSNLTKNNNLV